MIFIWFEIFFGGGGGWCAGLHPFSFWGASVVNSFNYGTDRIASDTPITVPIKHAPRVRFVVAFPPKRQMSTSGLETDNRTAAECNVTPFIITSTRNAIITGKLDERISQMSTMLMRYVFMDILTRYGKGFRRSNSTVKRTLVKLYCTMCTWYISANLRFKKKSVRFYMYLLF